MEQQGLPLPPESVLKIREAADARKHATAGRMLAEFLAGGREDEVRGAGR